MELIAVLTNTINSESGVSENGQPWKRVTAVFTTVESKPKTVAITCLGRMADEILCKRKNVLLKVQFDAESHDYNGRYYTELRAWSIKPAFEFDVQAETNQQPAQSASAGPNGHDFDDVPPRL